MEQKIVGGEVVWQPNERSMRESNLATFMREFGIDQVGAAGYRELTRQADADPANFWDRVIDFSGIQFYRQYDKVMDSSRGLPWTEWCVGGTTNIALNCLDKHRNGPLWNQPALYWEGEDGAKRQWTYRELSAETSRVASALRELGFGRGDVIGLYMPFVPEAAAALLAIVKIGAIVLPLFSGFGAQAISARLNDGGASGVIAAEGTWRRGKRVPMKPILDEAVGSSPTVRHVVVLGNFGSTSAMAASRDVWWDEVSANQSDETETEAMAADAPAMLIYTSGTTGKPKGTVHSHCGFLAKMSQDMGLGIDFKPSDRLMWMSDMGWIVGPILVIATTMVGGAMVLAEGAPDFPDKGRYWRLIEENRVSILGIAPTIIRNFMQSDGAGVERYDLSHLRLAVSTGEAWTPDAWTWMFEKVCQKRIPILNYSGGTEIGGAIVSGTLLHPMKPCAFGGPVPAMGADVVDELGRSVGPGGSGELVLRLPSIGMTRGLWHDPERYIESYWDKIPGLWWHGDRAAIDEDGYWYILGRSDDTLKIAGKRTGPSEIEALAMATGLVAEVAAIGVPNAVKGETVVLVATPSRRVSMDDTERNRMLSDAVVSGLGIPFKPTAVLLVPDLPKTRNMKIMRRVVRAAYLGQSAGDLSSLVNPESIDEIARLARQGSADVCV
jgi:acetyl-CoA synthetase